MCSVEASVENMPADTAPRSALKIAALASIFDDSELFVPDGRCGRKYTKTVGCETAALLNITPDISRMSLTTAPIATVYTRP